MSNFSAISWQKHILEISALSWFLKIISKCHHKKMIIKIIIKNVSLWFLLVCWFVFCLLVCVVVCFIIAYLLYISFDVRLWSKLENCNSDTCIVKEKNNSKGKFPNETITYFNSIIQTRLSPHYFRSDFSSNYLTFLWKNMKFVGYSQNRWKCRWFQLFFINFIF